MRLVFCLAFLSAGMVTMLGGCEANQLYMGSKTVVGVNAGVSPDQTSGWLVVGYDRSFAAIVPRSVEDPQTGKQEAMTVLACSRLAVEGVTIKYFKESIATGQAAEDFAKALKTQDPKPVHDFFDCFKNKPEAKAAGTMGGTRQ